MRVGRVARIAVKHRPVGGARGGEQRDPCGERERLRGWDEPSHGVVPGSPGRTVRHTRMIHVAGPGSRRKQTIHLADDLPQPVA